MSADPPESPHRLHRKANDESILRPALITTLFPLLPNAERNAFRLVLTGVTAVMLGIALLGWQAPLIGIVGLGVLVVFVAYLLRVRDLIELSTGAVLVTAVLGVVLGIGWALGTDAAIARESDDILGIPADINRVILTGLAIPLSFAICLLVPVAVIRLWRHGVRNALDGFVVGALGAYCFTSAVALVQLVPEFTAGLDPDDGRSTSGLVVAAAIQGVVIPITAAALAGAVGAAIGFRDRRDETGGSRWYAGTSATPWIALVIIVYVGLEVLDDLSVSDGLATVVYVAVAAVSLYASRIVLRATLPREVVPVRAERPTIPLLVAVAIVVALVAGASVATARWLAPVPPNYVCPPDCGRPPISTPVATNPRFTPESGEFSVSYPGPGTAYAATFEPNGVVLELLVGDGGTLRLFGQPAEGMTPKQIAKHLIDERYPGAITDYEIPNASVGYQLGYGEIADVFATDSIADESRNRILVMVAVKSDYALVAAAAAPYREFSPSFGSGHPSGANFFLALDMGKYVNSFTWRGDPPR